jgi:hypothetical protein
MVTGLQVFSAVKLCALNYHASILGIATVASPQFGHAQVGKVLNMTGFCGDGRAIKPIACGPDIEEFLRAMGLPGSEGCPIFRTANGISVYLLSAT